MGRDTSPTDTASSASLSPGAALPSSSPATMARPIHTGR